MEKYSKGKVKQPCHIMPDDHSVGQLVPLNTRQLYFNEGCAGQVLGIGQFGSVVKATVKEVKLETCAHAALRRSTCQLVLYLYSYIMQTGQEVAIKKVRLVQAKEVCWERLHLYFSIPRRSKRYLQRNSVEINVF